MPTTLAVLGGSSPFTLGLVAALAATPPWPDGLLRLQGRDRAALEVVARCATSSLTRCGWTVEAVPPVAEAVAGADVVLHQNRYGGWRWREEDERLAARFGLPPDETLGPGGLAAALRTVQGQRTLVPSLVGAGRVVTVTNPLGISTAAFRAHGITALGACEVPEMTRRSIAAALGECDPSRVAGAYTGLNHRGFWHHLTCGGRDASSSLLEALDSGAVLGGADAHVVRSLQAVPDKYFPLLQGGGHLRPGRARELGVVRAAALSEAAQDPQAHPPTLRRRDMPWHEVVVLPLLRALAGEATRLVLTLVRDDSIAVERQVLVRGDDVEELPQPEPPPQVRHLHAELRRHERAVLEAATRPSPGTVREALAADPTVPAEVTEPLTEAVLDSFTRWLAEEDTPLGPVASRRGLL